MIQLTPHMRILLAVAPVDFRRGIDGLSRVCRGVLREDPFSGYLFVFVNKRKTSIKILSYDGQGYWLAQKRFSQGRIRWWPDRGSSPICTVAAHELGLLLLNLDPFGVKVEQWREITPFRAVR